MSDEPGTDLVAADDTKGTLLSKLMQLARDPTIRPDVVAAFIQMQERLEDRQAEREFNAAFLAMQPELPRIKKNGTLEYPINKNDPDGPKRKIASFAKWEDIDEAIRPILTQHGFVLAFTTAPRAQDGGGLIVTAILKHQGGHRQETPIPVPLDTSGGKNNLQGYGSSLSYGKRYSSAAALNLIYEGEDDDGVRGGKKFITDAQTAELHRLLKQAGREENSLLQRLFSGTVHHFNELEDGREFIVVKNTLDGIIHQRQQRKPETG